MKILFIGDIVGKPGRLAVKELLPKIVKDKGIDFVIGNGENLAHGKGITESTYQEMIEAGIDYLTSGNHVWSKKEFVPFLDDKSVKVLRPANYPPGVPGRGVEIAEVGTQKLGIINLMGRTFFPQDLDCPFRKLDSILEELRNDYGDIPIVIDFHAEASSEKRAFGFYNDGRVSAVLGTHTHIQTSDEQMLPKGSAYISDVGMVGAKDSVLGVEKEIIIKKFLTQMLIHHEIPEGGKAEFGAVVLEVNRKGKAKRIERIRKFV